MTSTKTSKDKPSVTSPRITSRPTAASVARAARNAANRSLTLNSNQRQSPIRSLPSPTTSKVKTAISRSGQRTDSKTEVKINRNFENEMSALENEISTNRDSEAYYASPENLQYLDNARDEITFSSSAGDTKHIQDIMYFADSINLENISNVQEKESAITDYIQTPQVPTMSRPQTPKSISSRPQTPRVPSRPNTPAHPLQRHSTPISRPNTPQQNSMSNMTRPKTPSTPISSYPRPTTPVSSNNSPQVTKNHENLKSLYVNKQREFLQLKKELDQKQQAVLEVFDGVRNLRERVIGEGLTVESEGQHELAVLNVDDLAMKEVNELCRDDVYFNMNSALQLFNTAVPFDECKLADIESKALKVPVYFAELCLQAFTARQDLIDWVKDLIENNQEIVTNDESERIARYNSQGLELYEALQQLKTRADNAVDDIAKHARRMYQERSSLLTTGESLIREVVQLQQELQAKSDIINAIPETPPNSEIVKELEHTRRLLEDERKSKTTMKDKLATTESQLRQARLRVSKMDRQLREAEASITSLTGTVKTLEDQSRQREAHLEARARKLKETLKTGEVTNHSLTNQRESLKNEVKNLKEQLQTLTTKHKSDEQTWSNKLNDLISALDNEKKLTQSEMEQKQTLEAALQESQNILQKLKAKVSSLENNGPNSDLPTEREMDMWAELQATKDTLRATEEEIIACKNEKVRFLETLTKIAESDSKAGIQQKLAAELMNKEEILAKIQMQVRELSKSNKLYEQKIIQYEQYFRDLQTNNNVEFNCEDQNSVGYQHLQQEITKLKISLLDELHRREELAESLAEKEQQLERQDKTSRAQAKDIKVRAELINMLKNKETEQSKKLATLQQDLEHRMKIVDEVNKQIGAKADEIQELFTTLENKQQQIHRLEKIVFALEEQQTRSQAQRTRQEEKIAALEHELAAGNRRERKFLFF